VRPDILLLALLSGTLPNPASAAEDDPIWQAGRDIYYNVTRPDGSHVAAVVQGDVRLPPGAGACVSCHRRSGFGVAEGGEARALNVTGPALFNERTVPPQRPAYNDELLARAVVAGIDANGETLSELMPRYQLSAEDVSALSTYLRSLGNGSAPGVLDDELVIATILTPDGPAGERQALKTVIPDYVTVKNAGTRQEQRRALASEKHAYGLKRYRAYRQWRHSFWELEGDPATWPAQLQQRYDASPPFAILSGSVGEHADLVHDFCERNKVACILPLTDLPPEGEDGFYSLYLSAGMPLQARVIARQLATGLPGAATRILLVHNDDAAGNAAARIIESELASSGRAAIESVSIAPGSRPPATRWTRLLERSSPVALVPLVSAEQLSGLLSPAIPKQRLPARIITAEAFTDWTTAPFSAQLAGRIAHVYPYSLPVPGRSQFPREEVWLKSRGIELDDEVSGAKVLLACKALGMALTDIQSNFSGEYLLESLEHALDNSLMTSLYPRTTLGPGQRFLSRGAYVARLEARGEHFALTTGDWVRP